MRVLGARKLVEIGERMRRRTTLVCLAVASLALAACGSSKHATTTTATSSAPPPAPPATFHVKLVGYKGGSPDGSAAAVINVNPPTRQLCWIFSELKNVPSPTVARVYQNFPGATGAHGFKLGNTYTPSGCVLLHTDVLELMAEKTPGRFYVSIHDAQFPEGAVHGPLTPGQLTRPPAPTP
jgi:hypothetical protein